jgi:putative ABC transport system ATP-binding protein
MCALLTAGPFSARDGEGRELFRDVSIELRGGELVMLDGPSGSGKSSLLRQLVGLVPTTGVRRSLAGDPVPPTQLPRWRSQVTLAAQDAPMLAATVGENLFFPFRQKSSAGSIPDEQRLASLVDRVGLGAVSLDRPAKTLSGGERHRLALVRALLWDPPVLIADEPFSGLDEDLAAVCFDLLIDFAHRPGRAALCVLHDRTLAGRADRVVRLGSKSTGASS